MARKAAKKAKSQPKVRVNRTHNVRRGRKFTTRKAKGGVVHVYKNKDGSTTNIFVKKPAAKKPAARAARAKAQKRAPKGTTTGGQFSK